MKLTVRVGKEVDQYIRSLEKFTDATDGMLKTTIYPGAEVIADEIREAIKELPEIKQSPKETGKKATTGKKDTRKNRQRSTGKKAAGVTKVDKEGLLDGLGITKMRYDGSLLNAKIGMDGYNKHVTDKYPKGHPNAMIARSVESGTSFRQKTPFIKPTVTAQKSRAEHRMAAEFDKQVAKN